MSAARPELIYCPQCKRPNPVYRTVCWGCGAALFATPGALEGETNSGAPPAATPSAATGSPGPGLDRRAAGRTPSRYRSQFDEGIARSDRRGRREGPRKIRKGRFIVGLVLLVIGLLLIAASSLVNAGSTTVRVPAGSAVQLNPSTLGPVTVSVQWSTGGSNPRVYLVTGTIDCSSPSGVVVNASGLRGTFTATLNPGTAYALFACTGGTPEAATFTYSTSGGFTYLTLIGILLAIIGAFLLLISFTRPPDDSL